MNHLPVPFQHGRTFVSLPLTRYVLINLLCSEYQGAFAGGEATGS